MAPPHGWVIEEALPSDHSSHHFLNVLASPRSNAFVATPVSSDQGSTSPAASAQDLDAEQCASPPGPIPSNPSLRSSNKASCFSLLSSRAPASRESCCPSALSIDPPSDTTNTPIEVKPLSDVAAPQEEKELQLVELSVTITDIALAKFDFQQPMFLQIHSPILWTATPKIQAQHRTAVPATSNVVAYAEWKLGMMVPLRYPLEIDVKMQHSGGHKTLAELVINLEAVLENSNPQCCVAFESGFLTATFRRSPIPKNAPRSSFRHFRNQSNNSNPLSMLSSPRPSKPTENHSFKPSEIQTESGCFRALWCRITGWKTSRQRKIANREIPNHSINILSSPIPSISTFAAVTSVEDKSVL